MNEIMVSTSTIASNLASIVESITAIVQSNNETEVTLYRLANEAKTNQELIKMEGEKKIVEIDFITTYGIALLNSKKCSNAQKIEAFKFAIDELVKMY